MGSIIFPAGQDTDIIQFKSGLLRNSGIIRMPTSQREWSAYIVELNKWIENHEASFTPTFTGFSSDPSSALVNYVRFGPMVNVRLSFLTGTSDATTWTITNIPNEISPDTAQIVWIFGAHDGGSDSTDPIAIQISSTEWTFGLGVGNETGGGWTGSSAKGLQNKNLSFCYSTWSKGMTPP